jgi:hypothetical protein
VAEDTKTAKAKTTSSVKPLNSLLGRGTKEITSNRKGFATKPENFQSGPELGKCNAQIPLGSINGIMATCQSEDRVSLVSEVDIDLDQLEDSIKFFDLNNSTKTYLPHSNVSSQGDENDLETLKEHNEEARTTYPSYPKEKDDSPSSSVSVYSSSKSSSLLNGQGSVVWKNEDCGPDEV